MIDSIISCQSVDGADCIILTAGYDRTCSLMKGASEGGLKIVKCLHEDVEFFDRYNLIETGYIYKIAHKNLDVSNDLLPEEMVEKITKEYFKLMDDKKLIILLGGDHSVSVGPFKALAKKYKPEEVTIFQIDAHCDLRQDDANANPDQSNVSKFSHACVMRRAYDMGYNLLQVGIRSYAKEEYDFFKNNKKIKVFEWGKGRVPSIKEIIKSIKTKKVYITIDADGIDPAHMPAVGTPVPGGLEWYYTIELLSKLIKQKEIVGIDLVEVKPKEGEEATQFAAAQLCYNMMGCQLIKNGK